MNKGEITISVGGHEKREVSPLNHELFNKAKDILENDTHLGHIGWSGLGNFICWLEDSYEITKKK